MRSILIVIWDRWTIIDDAVQKFPEIEKKLPKDDNPIISLDTDDYFYKIRTNKWNQYIFQDILSFHEENLRKLNIQSKINFKNAQKFKLINKFRLSIKNNFYKFFNFLSKIKKSNKENKEKNIVILDKILSINSLMKLISINSKIFIASDIYNDEKDFKLSSE